MPQFEVASPEKEGVGTATFHKESDYKVVKLKSDKTGKERILHKIQADALIDKGLAEIVKSAKLQKREITTVVTDAPKDK